VTFVKLTPSEGFGMREVWIQPGDIKVVIRSVNGTTKVVLRDGSSYSVTESPEEALRIAFPGTTG
jgi:hypothetical protein